MKKSKFILRLLLVVLIAVGTLTGCSNKKTGEEFSFTFQSAPGEETIWLETDWDLTTSEAVLGDALREAGIITEEGLITTVNGITADYSADGAWWALHIDGEMSMQGVDEIEISEGVTYAFIYTQG